MRDGRHPFADQPTTGSRSVTLWTCVGPVAKILVVPDGVLFGFKVGPRTGRRVCRRCPGVLLLRAAYVRGRLPADNSETTATGGLLLNAFLGGRALPNGPPYRQGRPDQDGILDDVLPLQGESPWDLREAHLGQEDEWEKRAGHLQKEQKDGGTVQGAVEKPNPNRHLPPSQERDEEIGRDDVHDTSHQILRWTHAQGLQKSEPDKNYCQSDPENR